VPASLAGLFRAGVKWRAMNARELYLVRATLTWVFGVGIIAHAVLYVTVGTSWPLLVFVFGVNFAMLGFWWAEWRQRQRERADSLPNS
jgi:hypothetical protein